MRFSILTFTAFFIVFCHIATAQNFTVQGSVLDNQSQRPIEFATVVLKEKKSDAVLTGSTTDIEGNFQVETQTSDFYVEVSFIGFETALISAFNIDGQRIDLGKIMLSTNSTSMEDVVIQAEKSTTEFRLDKRVFNVGKDLSNTGASALEVLNNVPSVNVNIEGEISLRGSQGVQILINGKPSILASDGSNALGTITADMIEKIEIITNPSAKYEAEGTSGILNIILKKEEREGINGSVTVNTGIPHNHSVGVSLNRRTEKFNLFSQLGAGYRELPRENRNINQDLIEQSTLFNNGEEFRNEQFYNLILGTDYYINAQNVLTLSGSFAYEIEDQPSRTNFYTLGAAGERNAEWFREETTEANNPKYRYELQYKRDFKDHKKHDLLISALGNFFGKDQNSLFEESNLIGSRATGNQKTQTSFQESKYTFQLDYTKPFSDKYTLETGAHYLINDVGNDFSVEDLVADVWVLDSNLTNDFKYSQDVLGAYVTGAYEQNKWGIKLGLRVENTDLNTLLVTTNRSNNQNFTNLFPSAHGSYKVSERFSLQAGYSRRIFRPRLWDLNPFFNIRNNFSIRTGNPDLLPEFTDAYELTGIYILEKISLNASVYRRYTTDVVERISTFEDGVSTFMPFNIGTNQTTGLEINGKYSPLGWLSFNGDFNYNYFKREGILEATSFDFAADQWSSKLTTKLKLPFGTDFETTSRYNSDFQNVQGTVSAIYALDLGIRKKIFKGKAILNFSVRDLFASNIRERETVQPNFYLYNWSRRGRFITLGFSYGFGKGEAMEFTGRRRH